MKVSKRGRKVEMVGRSLPVWRLGFGGLRDDDRFVDGVKRLLGLLFRFFLFA